MLAKISPEELICWYNKNIGKAYLRQSGYRPSFHILDCTDLEVNVDNENYEGNGIVKRKKKKKNGGEEEETVWRKAFLLSKIHLLN